MRVCLEEEALSEREEKRLMGRCRRKEEESAEVEEKCSVVGMVAEREVMDIVD